MVILKTQKSTKTLMIVLKPSELLYYPFVEFNPVSYLGLAVHTDSLTSIPLRFSDFCQSEEASQILYDGYLLIYKLKNMYE